KRLAAEAYAHTAAYDVAVASWFASSYAPADEVDTTEGATAVEFPDFLGSTWQRHAVLRYGENPHQRAALYRDSTPSGLAHAEQRVLEIHRRPRLPSPGGCTARRCRTTPPSPPARRAVRRSTSPNPPWRSSSTPIRVASPWAWTSPRRTARHMPVTRCPPSVGSSR